jgi:hypothetical protein
VAEDWARGAHLTGRSAMQLGYSSYHLTLTRCENGFWKCAKTWLAGQCDVAGQPHCGLVEPVPYATSFPRVILSVTMPYFGHNEDMHGFWPIWCFSIIQCS